MRSATQRFLVVDGMGHDLPEPVWEPVVDALTALPESA
jgi:hypothetical protein